VNIVGICRVHGDYSKIAVRIARLNGSRGQRSGSAWPHRIDGDGGRSQNHSNKDGISLAESGEGRLLIKENTLPSGTYPTQSGSVRVPRVGECADKLHTWPPSIQDKNRMR